MSRLRAKCPDCRTQTAVALGPEYECHACGRTFAAGMVLNRLPPPLPIETCLRCGGPLDSLGVEQFRVGGTTGGWKLLFGELAELGEGTIPLEMLGCRRCRHVELRLPAGG